MDDLIPALLLFAEGESYGVSGWTAAFATAGLLGPVLYWLCYVHLPAKDKQLKELIDAKDKQIMDAVVAHAREATNEQQTRLLTAELQQKGLQAMVNAFNEQLEKERSICEKRQEEMLARVERHHEELIARYDRTHDLVREVRHEVGGIAQARANERAAQEIRHKSTQPTTQPATEGKP